MNAVALVAEPDPIIRVAVKTITPADAEKLLGRNSGNRNVRNMWVAQLARDMSDGNWQENGDTIRISADGNLLDGQHRLLAVVASGVSIRCLVVTGLPPEVQDSIDIGSKRTPADALRWGGWEADAKDAAALARGYLLFKSGTKPTNAEIIAWARENEEIANAACHVARQLRSQRLVGAGVGVYGTAWLELMGVDPVDAGRFFDSFITGTDLAKGSPILLLRKHFSASAFSTTRDRQTTRDAVALIFRAWNAWRKNEPLTVFRKIATFPDPK